MVTPRNHEESCVVYGFWIHVQHFLRVTIGRLGRKSGIRHTMPRNLLSTAEGKMLDIGIYCTQRTGCQFGVLVPIIEIIGRVIPCWTILEKDLHDVGRKREIQTHKI